MPTKFPVIVLTTTERAEFDGARVAEWSKCELDDGSSSLLIFDSNGAFEAYDPEKRLVGVQVNNEMKFRDILREAKPHGITGICWNMRSDGTYDRHESIGDYLRRYEH